VYTVAMAQVTAPADTKAQDNNGDVDAGGLEVDEAEVSGLVQKPVVGLEVEMARDSGGSGGFLERSEVSADDDQVRAADKVRGDDREGWGVGCDELRGGEPSALVQWRCADFPQQVKLHQLL
jgi:hypothetical protein